MTLQASGALVDLLRSEFNLMAHVGVVQKYFLMEAGAVMHQFTHELFQRVSCGTSSRVFLAGNFLCCFSFCVGRSGRTPPTSTQ